MYSMTRDACECTARDISESYVRALMENGYSMEDAFEVLKMDERMRSFLRKELSED